MNTGIKIKKETIRRILFWVLWPFFFVTSLEVLATKTPRDGRLDPRIKVVEYERGQVYQINAHYLQTTMITFAIDEEIVHVSIGDPIAWSAPTVNNYISLKPLLEKANTNMNLLTKNTGTGVIRSYIFELNASEANDIISQAGTFMMRFVYPEDEMVKAMAIQKRVAQKSTLQQGAEVMFKRKKQAEDWNMEYTYAGDMKLLPVRVFDDGEFTFFKFPKSIDLPAVFLVDEEGLESLINFHIKGDYLVVQRLGRQFIVRDGNKATCIFNNAFGKHMEQSVLTSHNDVEPASAPLEG